MTNPPSVDLLPNESCIVRLPWRGSKSANYDWLKAVCGDRTRPKFVRSDQGFRVARKHARKIIDALVAEYKHVIVRQFGNITTTCVEACWNAKPETAIDSECGCASLNHGSGSPFGKEVQAVLSVSNQHTVVTYDVTAQGWTPQ